MTKSVKMAQNDILPSFDQDPGDGLYGAILGTWVTSLSLLRGLRVGEGAFWAPQPPAARIAPGSSFGGIFIPPYMTDGFLCLALRGRG